MSLHQAVIAVGTNLGDRLANVRQSLKLLADHGIEVLRTSRLYETAPQLVTEQPPFVNAALAVQTRQSPQELLRSLKAVEAALGRTSGGQRYGPRPLDLDIIFYDDAEVADDNLVIPHARWQERSFVQAPVCDLFTDEELGLEHAAGVNTRLKAVRRLWQLQGAYSLTWKGSTIAAFSTANRPPSMTGEALVGQEGLQAVLPLGSGGLWPWKQRTQIMAILNLTPDSFSDGGQIRTVNEAVQAARLAVAQGADIIDIGGQSTRPKAQRIDVDTECSRIVPAIRALASDAELQHIPISVDTFYSQVAEEAVAAGASMVNDVSGGTLDPSMYKKVASLGVPYVLMHMRGNSITMQEPNNTTYDDVCTDVGNELQFTASEAIAAGIAPWSLMLDPGISFAKTDQGSCALINGLARVRQCLPGCLQHMPFLVGPSRKGFLGRLTGQKIPNNRDAATAAAVGLCIASGANIVRVHNVVAGRDAARVADAICRH